jgi:HAMP domain-containing protein
MTEMAVYNENGKLIAATMTSPGTDLPAHVNRSQSSYLQFEYIQDNETYLASGWSLFLASIFNAPTWTVILSASTTDVLSTMLEFQYSFPLIIALALWIILLLSLYFIRKTLTPLAILREGTKRISARDFTQPVEIVSGDEFEQLARSFNTMASQLHQQFHTLALIDEIDRSILSSLDASVIVPRSLRLIAEFFSCPLITLAECSATEQNRLRLSMLAGSHRNDLMHDHATLDKDEWPRLFTGESYTVLSREIFLPSFLKDTTAGGVFLFLPLETERRVHGALILAFPGMIESDAKETIAQARQLADQLAIALANARLLTNLEQLSVGTLEALARTVDAKSKWTAGHSERVAELAVRIGRAMRCGDHLLEQLYRSGLLHDIGKIGIPVAILDKPGKLDDEEYAIIKTHPEIGGKILEPIQPYQDVIPIIVQHHERFDGKGYPGALAGETISLGARILSVADVYDALISQRPYRDGWVKENVLIFMRENRGIMFDPRVVDTFLALDL